MWSLEMLKAESYLVSDAPPIELILIFKGFWVEMLLCWWVLEYAECIPAYVYEVIYTVLPINKWPCARLSKDNNPESEHNTITGV